MKIPVDDKTIQARRKIAEILAFYTFDKEIQELSRKICLLGNSSLGFPNTTLFKELGALNTQFNQFVENLKGMAPKIEKMILNYLVTSLPEDIINIEYDKRDGEVRKNIIPCVPYALGLAESNIYRLLCEFSYDVQGGGSLKGGAKPDFISYMLNELDAKRDKNI